jgi:hypothetical protein
VVSYSSFAWLYILKVPRYKSILATHPRNLRLLHACKSIELVSDNLLTCYQTGIFSTLLLPETKNISLEDLSAEDQTNFATEDPNQLAYNKGRRTEEEISQ